MNYPPYTNELDSLPKLSIETWSAKQRNIEKTVKEEELLEKNHTSRVTKAFKPIRLILLILGRSPFVPLVKKVKTERIAGGTKTQTYYEPSMKSPYWIYFFCTSLFLAILLLLTSMGFADRFLGWNFILLSHAWSEEETKIFQRNLVPFLLFWTCLVSTTVGNISFVSHRKKITKYMNDWNITADEFDIQVPSSLTKFFLVTNLWYIGFLIVIFICYAVRVVPIVRGISSLIAILTFRPFIFIEEEEFWKFQIYGILTLLYCIYSSRVLLMVFTFILKLLRHCFKIWNERLTEELGTQRYDKRCDSIVEKISCEKLYKDHCRLTQIVRNSDLVFGAVLQAYYSTQILNMCFELYWLARSGLKDGFGVGGSDKPESEIEWDILAALALLLQNLYFFYTVSIEAAYVTEEAMKGFEVIRARGLHPDDSVYKKYLISSLQVSYSHRIVLTGGKFFAIDRPFIVTVIGSVVTYFVIILQFGPTLISTNPNATQ